MKEIWKRIEVEKGRDIEKEWREDYKSLIEWKIWIMEEIEIWEKEIEEVIGKEIGINIMLGIKMEIGVIINEVDVIMVIYLKKKGLRRVEEIIIKMIGVIEIWLIKKIIMEKKKWGEVIKGFEKKKEIVRKKDMIYIEIGIIGEKVMKNNIYMN